MMKAGHNCIHKALFMVCLDVDNTLFGCQILWYLKSVRTASNRSIPDQTKLHTVNGGHYPIAAIVSELINLLLYLVSNALNKIVTIAGSLDRDRLGCKEEGLLHIHLAVHDVNLMKGDRC